MARNFIGAVRSLFCSVCIRFSESRSVCRPPCDAVIFSVGFYDYTTCLYCKHFSTLKANNTEFYLKCGHNVKSKFSAQLLLRVVINYYSNKGICLFNYLKQSIHVRKNCNTTNPTNRIQDLSFFCPISTKSQQCNLFPLMSVCIFFSKCINSISFLLNSFNY